MPFCKSDSDCQNFLHKGKLGNRMDLLPPSQHLLFVVACTVVILISSNISAISASLSADFFSVKLLYFSWDPGFFEGFLLDINVTGETKN